MIKILDKQINLYSVDTGHFYSNNEAYLHNMNYKYRKERNYIYNKLPKLAQQLKELGYSSDDISSFRNDKPEKVDIIAGSYDIVSEYIQWNKIIVHKRKKANESKQKLLKLLENKVRQNEITNGNDHIRYIKKDSLKDINVISVFESDLTRTIGIAPDDLTDALMVVQIYYFDIFKDISFYGFMYHGEKYKYFTSSAGQIRKKKAVFIKESVWNQIEKTIMCGLSVKTINDKGGNNVNKHLTYMALSNSATDIWKGFDIDKSIVIDDFETDVYGTYDFIDEADYSITRKTGYIPVMHTDGAGMMLPAVMDKNTMFRLPWIKGLLGVFDFKRFVSINRCSSVIYDIYGQEHDIIAEDIQIIFTKSQFKMWKYYHSWDEYKHYFKQYKCTAGICNTEEERIKNAKINYQMLQTLTDITDEEINLLSAKSVNKLINICNSEETMKEILGITPYNTNMNSFQKAVKIYPALLNDTYAKDILREIKNSLLKKYRSGKLEINGKYTFLLPDFYAACEYWFGHEEQPKGLLADQEVFCWLFKPYEKLDCLRSPHLYKEHAIRYNAANHMHGDKVNKIREWFTTNAIYTSSHDLISKLLQFDNDGDTSLVVADADFVRIAERNMNGIVPLYYNMKKAAPTQLNNVNIYNGLVLAFTGGNIGAYSNDISKIWNSDIFISGSQEEKQAAIDIVKLLCMENNFVIDYAKTLYKTERPENINQKIWEFTNKKLPAFFEFAKDKDKSQIEERNHSFVNKLYSIIPNKAINTRGLTLGKIDYRKLMSDVNMICSKEVSDLYDKINKEYRYRINMKDEYIDNLRYIACEIRKEFSILGYSDETITNMLVYYLYKNEKRYKQLLWFCYGNYVVANLAQNIETKSTKIVQCSKCGKWIEIKSKDTKTDMCCTCYSHYRKICVRENVQKHRKP